MNGPELTLSAPIGQSKRPATPCVHPSDPGPGHPHPTPGRMSGSGFPFARQGGQRRSGIRTAAHGRKALALCLHPRGPTRGHRCPDRVQAQDRKNLAANLPCILLMADGEACVLTGVQDETARIVMPETPEAPFRPHSKKLRASYSGHAVLARPRSAVDAWTRDLKIFDTKQWFWGAILHFLPSTAMWPWPRSSSTSWPLPRPFSP